MSADCICSLKKVTPLAGEAVSLMVFPLPADKQDSCHE